MSELEQLEPWQLAIYAEDWTGICGSQSLQVLWHMIVTKRYLERIL